MLKLLKTRIVIMDLGNNHSDSSASIQGADGIGPSEGETILSVLLPFLGKKELGRMSRVNRHLHDCCSQFLYYHMAQKYPQVSLIGSPASIPRMVDMHLPPRIVSFPRFLPEMFRTRGAYYSFPVPASHQPRINLDPRDTDAFASMTWSEKTYAIWLYAVKVKLWYLSVTVHRAEQHDSLFAANEDLGVAMVQDQPVPGQQMVSLLWRCFMLNRDLKKYPFFLQCFNQDEASKIKFCFYEQIIKETIPQYSEASEWPVLLSQELVESLQDDTSRIVVLRF